MAGPRVRREGGRGSKWERGTKKEREREKEREMEREELKTRGKDGEKER